eukprot:Pgem_evm1s19037
MLSSSVSYITCWLKSSCSYVSSSVSQTCLGSVIPKMRPFAAVDILFFIVNITLLFLEDISIAVSSSGDSSSGTSMI